MRELVRRLALYAVHGLDLARLRLWAPTRPGLRIEPGASSNLAHARFVLAPTARVRFAAGVVTERRPGWLSVLAEPGAEIVVEEGAWLRTEIAPVVLVAFEGARLVVGRGALLNGCTVSAKREVQLGPGAMVGPGSRIYDADQHARDASHPERVAPVRVGAHAWIAADATVLCGVTVGEHAVVGTRSLVLRDVAPHTLVAGVPAVERGRVGDRTPPG